MYKEKEKDFHCVPWNEIPDKSAKQETQRSAMSKKRQWMLTSTFCLAVTKAD